MQKGGLTRRALILIVTGGAVGALVGLGLLLDGRVGLGLFFLVGPPAMSVVNLLVVGQSVARQQNGAPRRRGAPTGRTLAPAPLGPVGGGASWTGGANVATDLGRMNASAPLAVLSMTGDSLALHLRPKLVGRLFGARPLVWHVDEVLAVYPVRGRLLKISGGIAVESSTAPLAYFWTRRADEVLPVLAGHGLPVDWIERDVRYLP